MRYFTAAFPLTDNHEPLGEAVDAFRGKLGELGFASRTTDIGHARLVASGTIFEPNLELPAPAANYLGRWLLGDLNLYNRQELADWALSRGHAVPSNDLDLVCIYLVVKGHAAVADLVADFSLVFYEPEAGMITLVRDHLGLRPLYWVEHDTVLYVSNLASTLHRVPGLRTTISVNALVRQLVSLGLSAGESNHLEIRRIDPGTSVAVDVRTGI